MHAKLRAGLSHSTINHLLNVLSGVFKYAERMGWATTNPVASVERPPAPQTDPDIRYLDRAEVEALLRATPDDALGATDRVLYLAAVMTGMRQGELCALRWLDVDWAAGVIRVRRSYTRGRWGTPKSRRSSRTVPMADRLAGELDRHFKRSEYRGDDELVFCHPHTGHPYDASKMRKRFKSALARAGLRDARLHDLRHSFGTALASAGAPPRAVQDWLGHKDARTTAIYAGYAPDPSQGRTWAERAFGGAGINPGINMSETQHNSDRPEPLGNATSHGASSR
jgi:integrase